MRNIPCHRDKASDQGICWLTRIVEKYCRFASMPDNNVYFVLFCKLFVLDNSFS